MVSFCIELTGRRPNLRTLLAELVLVVESGCSPALVGVQLLARCYLVMAALDVGSLDGGQLARREELLERLLVSPLEEKHDRRLPRPAGGRAWLDDGNVAELYRMAKAKRRRSSSAMLADGEALPLQGWIE